MNWVRITFAVSDGHFKGSVLKAAGSTAKMPGQLWNSEALTGAAMLEPRNPGEAHQHRCRALPDQRGWWGEIQEQQEQALAL